MIGRTIVTIMASFSVVSCSQFSQKPNEGPLSTIAEGMSYIEVFPILGKPVPTFSEFLTTQTPCLNFEYIQKESHYYAHLYFSGTGSLIQVDYRQSKKCVFES